jgi:hypothetical protein
MAYVTESRFFLLGRTFYPVYMFFRNRTIPAQDFEDIIVYCDYYTWHSESQWRRGHSDNPLLGFYESNDKDIVDQHVRWAEEFGIDVLKIEYIPQFDESVKNFTQNLSSVKGSQLKFCFMYDSRLRFESAGYKNPPYNFDEETIYSTFTDDLDKISEAYFGNENYFKIDGKPVLWIYVARDFSGNYRKAIADARKLMEENGYEVYLVGDAVFWNYRFGTISSFDAVSCYSAYGGRPQNTEEFGQRLKFLYLVWKIAASALSKDFIPSGLPAYDDTCLSAERPPLPVLKGTPDEFKEQLEILSGFLDPVDILPDISQVSIATFNEHQEGTSVEPSVEWKFERIKQIPEVFGYN